MCTNERENKDSCAHRGSKLLLEYLKKQLKRLPLENKTRIRVSSAGCMGRCKLGPVLVIYPQGIWYHCQTTKDIDEIINTQLLKKQTIDHLLLPDASAI